MVASIPYFVFVIGVLPVTMDDVTSGYNTAEILTS